MRVSRGFPWFQTLPKDHHIIHLRRATLLCLKAIAPEIVHSFQNWPPKDRKSGEMAVPSRKLTARPWKLSLPLKRKDHLPTIHSQVFWLLVSGRVCFTCKKHGILSILILSHLLWHMKFTTRDFFTSWTTPQFKNLNKRVKGSFF